MRQRFFFASFVLCLLTTFFVAQAGVTVVPLCENDKNENDFPFVGKIVNFKNGICGSAVFINEGKHIITSKHCVTHDGKPDGMLLDSSNFLVQSGDDYYMLSKLYDCPHSDIAIGALFRTAKYSIKLMNGEAPAKSSFYGAGYGKSSTKISEASIEFDVEYGTKRVFKNTLQGCYEEYGPSGFGGVSTSKIYYFNLRHKNSKYGEPIQGEGMPGPGDSGGGLFYLNNKNLEMFAVIYAVQTSSPYLCYAIDVGTQKAWIESICPDAFSRNKVTPLCVQSDSLYLNYSLSDKYRVYGLNDRRRLRVIRV